MGEQMSAAEFRTFVKSLPVETVSKVVTNYNIGRYGNTWVTAITNYTTYGGSKHPVDKARRRMQMIRALRAA